MHCIGKTTATKTERRQANKQTKDTTIFRGELKSRAFDCDSKEEKHIAHTVNGKKQILWPKAKCKYAHRAHSLRQVSKSEGSTDRPTKRRPADWKRQNNINEQKLKTWMLRSHSVALYAIRAMIQNMHCARHTLNFPHQSFTFCAANFFDFFFSFLFGWCNSGALLLFSFDSGESEMVREMHFNNGDTHTHTNTA